MVDTKRDQHLEGFTYAIAPQVVPQVIPGDSGFGSQWHLVNTSYPGVDVNVTDVWDDYQGNGVVVGVVDTGIDYNHPDLNTNYRFDLDYDARSGDSDSFASASDDNHGTTVAGVIG
ncbi:MAG: S8 family serine peptidase, partial [Rhodospirillales bacterium]|nr:S8 family serine peptidase [Rhodospirillales bacterium]